MRPSSARLLVAVALLTSGCASAPEQPHPAAPSPAPPPAPPPAPAASAAPQAVVTPEMIAGLRWNDQNLREAAAEMAAAGGEPVRNAVAARLVQLAREVDSTAWRVTMWPHIQAANTAAGIVPTLQQFGEQIDMAQTERFVAVLDAMRGVGGAEIASYCFEVAENDGAPRERRLAALRVLEVTADSLEPAAAARRAAVASRLASDSPPPASSPGQVSNAVEVVTSLTPKFRRCYNQLLQANPGARVEGRLTLRLDAAGAVADVKSEGIPPGDFAGCLESVARAARFAPPSGGGATIVIPVKFLTQ